MSDVGIFDDILPLNYATFLPQHFSDPYFQEKFKFKGFKPNSQLSD